MIIIFVPQCEFTFANSRIIYRSVHTLTHTETQTHRQTNTYTGQNWQNICMLRCWFCPQKPYLLCKWWQARAGREREFRRWWGSRRGEHSPLWHCNYAQTRNKHLGPLWCDVRCTMCEHGKHFSQKLATICSALALYKSHRQCHSLCL